MSAAKKMGYRAPRYILNAQELKLVRVAPRNRKRHQIYELEIIDMSESGMSFIANWKYLPSIGEILKVEFPVPGESKKVAWFAEVIRLEGPSERPKQMNHFSGIKVAVRFVDLPKGHLVVLREGIDQRLHALEVTFRWDLLQGFFGNFTKYAWEFGKLLLIVGAATAFFYFVTRNVGNYDPDKPVNWGERFFEKVIPK